MSDPRSDFKEAMRWLWEDHVESGAGDEDHFYGPGCGVLQKMRRVVIAFANVTFVQSYRNVSHGIDEEGEHHVEQVPVGLTRENHRAALLRDCGLEVDCAHEFETNYGMYDSTHPYCRKCGMAK